MTPSLPYVSLGDTVANNSRMSRIIWMAPYHLRSIVQAAKGLWKAEYSDFRIIKKFETQNIPYISKLLPQNRLNFFAKYLFRLEFQLKNLITSSECRALQAALVICRLNIGGANENVMQVCLIRGILR